MKLLKILIVIITFFTLLLVIYLQLPHSTPKLLYIPSINEPYFEEALKLQKIPLKPFELKLLDKYKKVESKWIRLNKDRVSKIELIKAILNNPPQKTRIMIMYGGSWIKDFIKTISKQANLDFNQTLATYYNLAAFKEGGIIAGKYKIPYNTTPNATIAYMVYKSNSFFKEMAKRYQVEFDSKEFREKVIIASIIQKETSSYDDMPFIASVIYNRLKKGIKLQLDATLNYGKNSHTIITPTMIRNDTSKFNTYKFKGLPPSPIGSFSKSALFASFAPAKSEYLYFVKRGKTHIFSSTYQEHKKHVKAYKERVYKNRAKKIAKILKEPIKIELNLSLRFKPDLLIYKLKLK
ncbi:MAG: endolytic transglycosylase MltG [Epsilonproteobacteria bacterium]|nr:endolytic transglycosylase MltG [Campylobacterota bacterium]